MPISRNQDAVQQPDDQSRRKGSDSGEPAEIVFLEKNGEDEAGKGDDRREGKIDLARPDHKGQPGRQKDERRQCREECRVDEGLQENLRRGVHEERNQQGKDQDDRQAFKPLEQARRGRLWSGHGVS